MLFKLLGAPLGLPLAGMKFVFRQIADLADQELNDEGVSVLVVTHEPDIARHARRLVQLRDGKIVSDGPIQHRLLARDWLTDECCNVKFYLISVPRNNT